MQSDLDLIASKAEDVYDIAAKDYPDKYQSNAEKSKMVNLVEKAVKSAAEFNSTLMRDKRLERHAYFDLQTSEIHFPGSLKHIPKTSTNVGHYYPIAVLPGQYQDYYKRYSTQELKYMPINTALYSSHKQLKSLYCAPTSDSIEATDAIHTEQETLLQSGTTEVDVSHHENVLINEAQSVSGSHRIEVAKDSMALPTKDIKASSNTPDKLSLSNKRKASRSRINLVPAIKSPKSGRSEISSKPPSKQSKILHNRTNSRTKQAYCTTNKLSKILMQGNASSPACHSCQQTDKNKNGEMEELITCSECHSNGHPSCLDMTKEMIPIVKTYSWQCMDCKTCAKCMDSQDEEKMMFCDHCDRGYHTYCVGLETIPAGRWECPRCSAEEEQEPVKTRPKRGRPFKHPRKELEINVVKSAVQSSPPTDYIESATNLTTSVVPAVEPPFTSSAIEGMTSSSSFASSDCVAPFSQNSESSVII